MKKDTHPQYFPKATVECACGSKFAVGSTKELIKVEICSACHPFYTGTEKSLDSAGRVEKFRSRIAAAAPKKTAKAKKEEVKEESSKEEVKEETTA
jgi:large subunit ribosomal protein L31